MSVRTWHVYELSTGLFLGRSLSYSASSYAGADPGKGETTLEQFVTGQLEPGLGAIEGVTDWLSQRVEGGAVVDYQPPAPSAEHEWNAAARRWRLTATEAARQAARAAATARIAELEISQGRAVREALIALGAGGRIAEIDAAIAALRPTLM